VKRKYIHYVAIVERGTFDPSENKDWLPVRTSEVINIGSGGATVSKITRNDRERLTEPRFHSRGGRHRTNDKMREKQM